MPHLKAILTSLLLATSILAAGNVAADEDPIDFGDSPIDDEIGPMPPGQDGCIGGPRSSSTYKDSKYEHESRSCATADDVKVSTFTLPAGHMIEGKVIDGEFVLSIVPTPLQQSTAMGIDGYAECYNDEPGYAYYDWWTYQWHYYPSVFFLTNNPWALAPLHASAGQCAGWWTTFDWAPTYLSFSTGGNSGGFLRLYGWTSGAYGEYSIECRPAGVTQATGVYNIWRSLSDVQDGWCKVQQYGIQPGQYAMFYGEVGNYNTVSGQASWAQVY